MRSLAVFPRPTEPAELAAMVHLDDVVRVFGRGDGQVRALDGVTLSMARGTFTAIMGPSGSGKSTLLQLAAGLDRPTQGSVRLGELELNGLNERALARLRRERIGFVFQSFNLLGALTAEQNVALPARLAGRRLPRSVVRDVLGARRPRRAPRPSARPALGRPATARRHRSRPRRRAERRVRRRADRRARHARRPRRAGAPARDDRRERRDARHGHPRPVRGGVGQAIRELSQAHKKKKNVEDGRGERGRCRSGSRCRC